MFGGIGDGRHITHTLSLFLLVFLLKRMHVHVVLKIFVDMKNCDFIFIGELKILNT
jgi:hypothetical protein